MELPLVAISVFGFIVCGFAAESKDWLKRDWAQPLALRNSGRFENHRILSLLLKNDGFTMHTVVSLTEHCTRQN